MKKTKSTDDDNVADVDTEVNNSKNKNNKNKTKGSKTTGDDNGNR
jgi:hypothetical protein